MTRETRVPEGCIFGDFDPKDGVRAARGRERRQEGKCPSHILAFQGRAVSTRLAAVVSGKGAVSILPPMAQCNRPGLTVRQLGCYAIRGKSNQANVVGN